MELQDCINFVLSDAQNSVFIYFKTRLQNFDVTPVQYALLKCLWTEDMQTPTQLSQMLNLDTSSITGTLDRLERKGLIKRVYSKEDRRSVFVCLEDEGRALQDSIEEVIADANEKVLADIPVSQYHVFHEILSAIVQNTRALGQMNG